MTRAGSLPGPSGVLKRGFRRVVGDAEALGGRLREVDQQQGLTLYAVDRNSGGTWKPVIIGSYESGGRAVTVRRLVAQADFYGVPALEMLPGDPGIPRCRV